MDIASKTFAERFPKESLEVYGLHLPKIVNILPTNLPQIAANELRIEQAFLSELDSAAMKNQLTTKIKRHEILTNK